MIQNIQIFDCPIGTPTAGNTFYGAWTNISNLSAFSISFIALEGNVWVEASNDANVLYDGVTAIAAPSAPTLSSFQYGHLTNQGSPSVVISYIIKGGGETVASAPTALAVADGFQLVVNPPALDPLGVATGYNVYISNGGLYYLQNMPNSSDRFGNSHNGPMPLGRPFIMYDGFQSTGVVPSVVGLVGGPAIGTNISGNMVTATSSGEIEIVHSGTNPTLSATISPSSLEWFYVRVGKDNTAVLLETKAWLAGRWGA